MTTLPLDAELPWLRPAQDAFNAALASDRLGHALLVQVSPGQGGQWLAVWIAARLFCRKVDSDRQMPCGSCLDCRRVMSNEQPDLLRVHPIEDSKEIRVDQIRELSAELTLTSHAGGRKVVIVSPAERLNRNAANALLKTLEEPSGSALLLLVTGEPSRLPATVRSRCTRLLPGPANDDLFVYWRAALGVLGPQPLAALEADTAALGGLRRDTERALEDVMRGTLDVVDTADRWGKDDYALRVACVELWLIDRLRDWGRGRRSASSKILFEALDHAREARQWAESPVNKPLAIERVLWRLATAAQAAASQRPVG